MKELKISKHSWHYYLITNYTTYNPGSDLTDFCSYVRAIFVGLFSIACLIGIGSVFFYGLIVQEVMYIISGFDSHFIDDNNWLKVGLIIWFLLTFIAVCSLLKYITKTTYKKIMNLSSPNYKQVDKPDSVIYNIYKKYKDKVCYKIKIIE
jgi:hypothetical protein